MVMVFQESLLWAADVSVGDTSASATVVVIAVVLIVLSAALAVLAIWLWRVTAVDSPFLMVLERMSSRRYREADSSQKESLRTGAVPVVADDDHEAEEVRSEE